MNSGIHSSISPPVLCVVGIVRSASSDANKVIGAVEAALPKLFFCASGTESRSKRPRFQLFWRVHLATIVDGVAACCFALAREMANVAAGPSLLVPTPTMGGRPFSKCNKNAHHTRMCFVDLWDRVNRAASAKTRREGLLGRWCIFVNGLPGRPLPSCDIMSYTNKPVQAAGEGRCEMKMDAATNCSHEYATVTTRCAKLIGFEPERHSRTPASNCWCTLILQ